MLAKEIAGNCRVSWSPLKSQPGYMVLGSKQGGGGFNDYGGTFQLVSLDVQTPGTDMSVLCEMKTGCVPGLWLDSTRFFLQLTPWFFVYSWL